MAFPLATEIHQVLDHEGNVVSELPNVSESEHLAFYRWMVLGRLYSDRMIALQRQGRMGTFGPLKGQEASAAIATALEPDDWLMGSYREIIPYWVKGVPLTASMESTRGQFGTGYPPTAKCLPMQIVLATQMLHAAGIAMAIKYDESSAVSVGVCGDGASSEGDFNESLNFAAVFNAPFIAVVQNNGWAISVPRSHQTKTEYIAHRGPAFGMPGIVVDGNDILAVHKVMSDAIARARAGDGPSLIEMITYRMDAHTTADDPTRYQPEEELAYWKARDPLTRYRHYLRNESILSNEADEQIYDELTNAMQAAVDTLEAQPPTDPNHVFDMVYAETTPQMEEQRAEILGGKLDG